MTSPAIPTLQPTDAPVLTQKCGQVVTPLDMATVVQGMRRMPSLPNVVMELLASLDADEAPVGSLAQKIGQDQALTAKTLRLANSSFYGRAQRVGSMTEAIAVLGFRTVRNVVTTAGLIQTMQTTDGKSDHLLPFWRHAIATAVCARELATHLQVSPDHAYTAGLLHDIGRLVLAAQFPTHFAEVLAYQSQQDCSMLEAEEHVLGLNHADIGASIANYWKFPQNMQDAIGQHHVANPAEQHPLSAVVHLANVLAHALELTPDPAEAAAHVAPCTWDLLPGGNDALQGFLVNVVKQYAQAIDILND